MATVHNISTMTGPAVDDESHVRVVALIRPLSKTEIERNSQESITSLSTLERSFSNGFKETNDPEVLQVSPPDGQKRWFEVDAVFDKNSTQEEVYIRCGAKKAVCENVFKGFNCTILAYGQVRKKQIKKKQNKGVAMVVQFVWMIPSTLFLFFSPFLN